MFAIAAIAARWCCAVPGTPPPFTSLRLKVFLGLYEERLLIAGGPSSDGRSVNDP